MKQKLVYINYFFFAPLFVFQNSLLKTFNEYKFGITSFAKSVYGAVY